MHVAAELKRHTSISAYIGMIMLLSPIGLLLPSTFVNYQDTAKTGIHNSLLENKTHNCMLSAATETLMEHV